jgi:hypothetical protein
VSLLFPDTLSLYIAPDRVQGVKTVGLSQLAVEVHQREVLAQAADNWQGLTRVCLELLRQTQVQRLRIVLSDKLARYACFPWRAELRNASEDLSMAMLNFDDVYGPNASAEWQFGFSAGRPGKARLSIAIAQSLFAVLQGHFGQKQARVVSIQTAFSATLQSHRKQLGSSGWLVNLEHGRLSMGSWRDDSWSWIYSAYAEIDSPQALLERVRQEILLSSTSLKAEDPVPIFVHAPALEHLPFGALQGVRFTPLRTAQKEAGAKYAFALMGVAA